jgi:hypothetical protein
MGKERTNDPLGDLPLVRSNPSSTLSVPATAVRFFLVVMKQSSSLLGAPRTIRTAHATHGGSATQRSTISSRSERKSYSYPDK